jgi:hypothetical protein
MRNRLVFFLSAIILVQGFVCIGEEDLRISVSAIYIAGSVFYPEEYIRSLLTFDEKTQFESFRHVESRLHDSTERLKGTGEYMLVDFYYIPVTDNEIEIFVSLIESTGRQFTTQMGDMQFFRNMLFMNADFGINSSLDYQAFGLLFALSPVFKLSAGIAHQSFSGLNNSIRPSLGLHYSLVPELTVSIPIEYAYSIDYPNVSRSSDLSAGVSLLLNFSYLKRIGGIGFRIESAIRQGFFEYSYIRQSDDVRIYFSPVPFFEIAARNLLQFSWGDVPLFNSTKNVLESNLRAPYKDPQPDGYHGMVLIFEPRLRDFVSLNLSAVSLGISLSGFFETAYKFGEVFDVDTMNKIIGGGIKLELKPPICLNLRLEYAYNLRSGESRFNLFLNDYF